MSSADPSNRPSDLEGSVTWYFARFRDGDDAALGQLWTRFFPRLQALAREILSRKPPRAAGPDDAVQDAFLSFWKRVRAGEFMEDLHRDHLWQLLAQFTVFKARRLMRRESAQKRGGGRVVNEGALALEPNLQRLDELAWQQPIEDVDMSVAEMLDSLPEELREYAVLRLIGNSTAEMAELLNCTQRKVQRKLELVRLHWDRLIVTE